MSNQLKITNDDEYATALARIDTLMDAAPDSAEADELAQLAAAVHTYEEEHYPIGESRPGAAIEFQLDQLGLKPNDLIPLVGSRDKVDALLADELEITPELAAQLEARLHIPAAVLLRKTDQPQAD